MSATILFGGLLLCFINTLAIGQSQNGNLPVSLPPNVIPSNGLTCPEVNHSFYRETARQRLQEYYSPVSQQPCSCGSTPEWTRVAYLNMSDPSSQCPSNWMLQNSTVRGCGRMSTQQRVCDSVTYTINQSYSRVCGRVIAIQRGRQSGFLPSIQSSSSLEEAYISGLSLTHGPPGSRCHIWSFVGAFAEQTSSSLANRNCPCSNSNTTWEYQLPQFVGARYFCDTGNGGSAGRMFDTLYLDDPLWDGQGCGSVSSCCTLNNPPWFYSSLSQSTSEDLELRHCYYESSFEEDRLVTLVEIFVQ